VKKFCFNAPFNGVSFGQVATHLLRGFFDRKIFPDILPIGGNVDLTSQPEEKDFGEKIKGCASSYSENHSRLTPTLKLWHINGAMESCSKETHLLTFHELDDLTKAEKNTLSSMDKVIVTNDFSKEVLKSHDIESVKIPLAFDKYNFFHSNKSFFSDSRITFNICGKFEHRKHHKKSIRAWVKKYGNNKDYQLQCALFNPFLSEDQNRQLFNEALDNKNYFNVQFLPFMEKNSSYNDFLNSGDIIIGMSGGEGWGLPEFQSLGIGKHSVILNAHSYKEWATEENSCLVEPSGKIEVYDDLFFKKGQEFNQGNIFDWTEESFLDGCERAIERTKTSKTNESGRKIKEDFTTSKMVDLVLEQL